MELCSLRIKEYILSIILRPLFHDGQISRRTALKHVGIGLFAAPFIASCGGGSNSSTSNTQNIQVVDAGTPYKGVDETRVGYSLKTWVYQNDGYTLQRIEILNALSGLTIQTFALGQDDWPSIFHDPVQSDPVVPQSGPLNCNYIPLQLRIPTSIPSPSTIIHKLTFMKGSDKTEISLLGGELSPSYSSSVLVLYSPVRGNNQIISNQGTNAYHFNSMFFQNGVPFTGERYAFDSIKTNDARNSLLKDNGSQIVTDNNAYVNYGEPIYAAASGTVVGLVDQFPEQSGNQRSYPITSENIGGNYVAVDIGGGNYAIYCHCIKGSFGNLSIGDDVTVGQQIASLGNSGNSDLPHLHFEVVTGSSNVIWSTGVPFVIDQFQAIASIDSLDMATASIVTTLLPQPASYTNIMPDQQTVINIPN